MPAPRRHRSREDTLAKLESDDTSVSLPALQAKPKQKITVAPADDAPLSLLQRNA